MRTPISYLIPPFLRRFFARDREFCLYLLGISLIAGFAYSKYANQVEWTETESPEFTYVPRPQLHTEPVVLPSHSALVMSELVRNEEYGLFVQDTNYQTWRERRHRSPTWRDGEVGEPVQWLVREDAEKYCRWLSDRAGEIPAYPNSGKEQIWQVSGFRLPTSEELQQLARTERVWEWTGDDLSLVSPNQANAKLYLTSWKQGELLHRRTQDLGHSDEYSVGFRVAWTR